MYIFMYIYVCVFCVCICICVCARIGIGICPTAFAQSFIVGLVTLEKLFSVVFRVYLGWIRPSLGLMWGVIWGVLDNVWGLLRVGLGFIEGCFNVFDG